MKNQIPQRLTALLLTLCLLLTAISGAAIQAQAEELGIAANSAQPNSTEEVTAMSFYYRHFYDSITFSSKQNWINSAVSFVNQVYMFNFPASAITAPESSIAVDSITSLQYCEADIDTPCNSVQGCGGSTAHHRDIGVIANTLYSWRTRTYGAQNQYIGYIVVLWTDYPDGAYCWYNNEDTGAYVHEYVSYNAAVFEKRPVIHIMDLAESTSSQRLPHMAILLAHETAHCIGLDDFYDKTYHEDDKKWECMLDYFDTEDNRAVAFYNAVLANKDLAFCDSCDATMRGRLTDWIDDYNYYSSLS